MYVLNKITNTTPIVFHRCGNFAKDEKIWEKLVKHALLPHRYHRQKDYTIITWNSSPDKGLLEKNLDAIGISYQVLGRNASSWNNSLKVILTQKALKKITTPYVIGLDCYDVVVLNNPDIICERFANQSAKLLFGAEPFFYPDDIILRNFEDSTNFNYYRYLNAGTWIGELNFCRDFFKKCCHYKRMHPDICFEQRLVKMAYMDFYPDVKPDHQCTIFQTMNTMNAGTCKIFDMQMI